MLHSREPIKIQNLRCAIPIVHDDEPDNRRQRELVYDQKRSILLNMARPNPLLLETMLKKLPLTYCDHFTLYRRWHLDRDLFKEQLPNEITRVI